MSHFVCPSGCMYFTVTNRQEVISWCDCISCGLIPFPGPSSSCGCTITHTHPAHAHTCPLRSYLDLHHALHGLDFGFTERSSVLGADICADCQVGRLVRCLKHNTGLLSNRVHSKRWNFILTGGEKKSSFDEFIFHLSSVNWQARVDCSPFSSACARHHLCRDGGHLQTSDCCCGQKGSNPELLRLIFTIRTLGHQQETLIAVETQPVNKYCGLSELQRSISPFLRHFESV